MGPAAKPTRENRTITVDFQNEATYFQLLGDGKAFVECVRLCRKFFSEGREGAVAPVGGVIRRLERKTIRPP